ncbi:SusD/RagB family nutrient-binding outer membrane lipoprotein [Prevotella sp. P6B1]|uniref:SusD/RagB family nutrient-binding outer membrane lipoprotein n=1 Tax=Prevotella sp. P6B1 TaxID=1410613 RepID=UPI00051C37CF|nr:SusD/RagB family nutrient-binding outer membrane lipoprotein [Prevotella sp. P6B1]
MITRIFKKTLAACIVGCGLLSTAACSDSYMEKLNTDDSKGSSIEPSAQLTTALLQTYGDFGMMDTYRSYITGFTQHFAGGWNVSNYGGSVHAQDDQMRLVWDQLYGVSIKNIVDAIANSEDKPNTNAALRIHRVYLMAMLTDIYGDLPCSEAGLGFISGIAYPKYDTQEEIYDFFFKELAECVDQLGTGSDHIGGDVTSLSGDAAAWRKYANTLRMRYAMRISEVNPTKAQEEFEKALNAAGGYITSSADDAYVIYTDGKFTLYDGSRDLDFRVNALGEILYGQDPTSPTFVSSTFFNILQDNNDPRLYRICRHYINTKRSETKPDREWNIDVTDEVIDYLDRANDVEHPCDPGAAWWNNWVNAPAVAEIPTLERMISLYPEAGFDGSNFPARMMRPFLSIDFEMPDRPGALINYAEVEFLLAEAKLNGWNVSGSVEEHFKAGVKASIKWMNDHYLQAADKISDAEISTFVDGLINAGVLETNAKEAINTQAWILHMMNPSEAWANLRRSDYPVLQDRTKLAKFESDFTYDDNNLQTPTRLRYPILENQYNSANYKVAVERLGGSDDWHKRLWWDVADINVK